MPEEEKTEEKPPEEKPEEKGEEKKSTDLIEKANLAALRQEEANKKHEELLNREERLKVEKTLGGETEAGTPGKTKEDKATESAREMLKGTGYDDQLFPIDKKS